MVQAHDLGSYSSPGAGNTSAPALTAVSFAVEVWRQPRVPDTGACSFEAYFEPAV